MFRVPLCTRTVEVPGSVPSRYGAPRLREEVVSVDGDSANRKDERRKGLSL
jgi:hypothetical protein